MNVRTVGILSPGDMGSAIGRMLRDAGLDVITCLDGHIAHTRLRASEAGMRDVPSLDNLVREAELLLSVLVPAEAMALGQRVADSIRRTGAHPVFADCNAIAPQTILNIGRTMADAGIAFIDAGIIGSPPRAGKQSTRIYCSGPDTSALESLAGAGLDIRTLGPDIGQASGLKMVYAASTKGITALCTELMVAARALGLEEALRAEFEISRSDVIQALIGRIPSMPRRARRWVGEMEEIAATFESLGMTPLILQGAADLYRFVGKTPLADQTSRQPDPSLDTVLDTLARTLR
ncbi:MAG: DUF1932 domain-containing protein [Dehalococcoidales bacterium]|nr:DUF1932 domain-containing protein [Dehalococcoidales bacterium]